ncbi:hypothetical protein BV375_10420 [Nostoc sp. 106C]|nr:hypothetical protein BV375_10420 [Nostoc sp. 106C]
MFGVAKQDFHLHLQNLNQGYLMLFAVTLDMSALAGKVGALVFELSATVKAYSFWNIGLYY